MAKRVTLPSGWIAYRIEQDELKIMQEHEIAHHGCDSCHCELNDDVYYIPVLESWACEDCFRTWMVFSKRFTEEDAEENLEMDKMELFEKLCRSLNIPIQQDLFSQS